MTEKKTTRLVFTLFLLPICLMSNNIYAEDSLSSIMQRMKSKEAVKIAYQEIRTLELINQPWHGGGFMYSLSPDLMIREQLKPQRLLMGVKGEQLYYFEPDNGVRHQGEMDISNPISLNIAVFKALMNADEELLKSIYQVDLTKLSQRWVMRLKPKQDSESGFSIVVSGQSNQAADTIIITQADGDMSEFMLQDKTAGNEIDKVVAQLYSELLGD